MKAIICNAPYAYLLGGEENKYHLFVCVPSLKGTNTCLVDKKKTGDIINLEYVVAPSDTPKNHFFFEYRKLTFNGDVSDGSVVIWVMNFKTKEKRRTIIQLSDADTAPYYSSKPTNKAYNCPYVYLTNPEEDDYHNLFYPHVISPIKSLNIVSQTKQYPQGDDGIYVGKIIGQVAPSSEETIFIPEDINGDHFQDLNEIDGWFETHMVSENGESKKAKAKVRTSAADSKPSNFLLDESFYGDTILKNFQQANQDSNQQMYIRNK